MFVFHSSCVASCIGLWSRHPHIEVPSITRTLYCSVRHVYHMSSKDTRRNQSHMSVDQPRQKSCKSAPIGRGTVHAEFTNTHKSQDHYLVRKCNIVSKQAVLPGKYQCNLAYIRLILSQRCSPQQFCTSTPTLPAIMRIDIDSSTAASV